MNNYFGSDDRSTHVYVVFWIGLLALMLMRNFYFGIDYFNVLDDYARYGVYYSRNNNIFEDIILYYRHFTWRPIAFIVDAYVTQWFWHSMWIVLLLNTTIHFFTVFIFHRLMIKSKIQFGMFGIVLISLSPILIDGIYWISASTRLVPGMFFSILSAFMLLTHIEREEYGLYGKKFLWLYILFNVISVGFSEQIIVFNLMLTVLLLLINGHRVVANIGLMYIIPILSSVFMAGYYFVLAPFGQTGVRNQMVGFGDIFSQIASVLRDLSDILVFDNFEMLTHGVVRGVMAMQDVRGVLFAIFLLFSTLIAYFVYKRTFLAFNNTVEISEIIKLCLGLILFIIPFGQYVLFRGNYVTPKNIYPAIFGIALVLDAVLDIAVSFRFLRKIRPVVSVVFIIPFAISYISGVYDRRITQEQDVFIAESFLNTFVEHGFSDQSNIILFNTREMYPYRVSSATDYAWSFLGKVNSVDTEDYYGYRLNFRAIEPVRAGYTVVREQWLNPVNVFLGLDYNNEIVRLELQGYDLYVHDEGVLFGRVELNEYYYFFVRE